MQISLAFLLLSVVIARAEFVDNQYTDHPDVLFQIVAAAENDERLKSFGNDEVALYLRRAEYIGPLNAPFGTVHVARLCYIRSAPKGAKHPARGHNYIVFLDSNFKIRTCWMIDSPDDSLYVDGTKLMSGEEVVMDYAHLPSNGTVLFDGKVMGVPKWDKR